MPKINRLELTVYGCPIAQPRHRITKFGGRYIPKEHPVHEWKRRLSAVAQSAISDMRFAYVPRPAPVWLEVYFKLPRSKSIPKKQQDHTKKPDTDNLVKAVKDAFKGVFYEDDSQVCRLIAYKDYVRNGQQPQVAIVIATNDHEKK